MDSAVRLQLPTMSSEEAVRGSVKHDRRLVPVAQGWRLSTEDTCGGSAHVIKAIRRAWMLNRCSARDETVRTIVVTPPSSSIASGAGLVADGAAALVRTVAGRAHM